MCVRERERKRVRKINTSERKKVVEVFQSFFETGCRTCTPAKMSEEVSARHVVKFDGKNFQLWKFQMVSSLMAHGIYDIVTGERARPIDINSVEGKVWVKENAKAMFIISSAMEYSQLEYLITSNTAKDMWTKLSSIHEQTSEANKLILLQRFHEYRMEVNDKVVQHIAKIQNMARQLKDVGERISDTAVMAKILGSLPGKFGALITAWDSVHPAEQTARKANQGRKSTFC